MPFVLLLTHRGDFYTIDRVQAAVERRGATAIRVDTDRFPAELALSVRLRRGEPSGWLVIDGRAIDLTEVSAVWMRRLWTPTVAPSLDPRWIAISQHHAHLALTQLLPLLSHARWLDHIDRQLAAESKPRQLLEAARVGLKVPDTLFSNDPVVARRFATAREGRTITKLLEPISHSMEGGRGDFVYTSRLRPSDLDAMEGLRWVPQIFQPEVPKDHELRVVVVGDRVFAGSIDARGTARGEVDWRRLRADEGPAWREASLPDAVADRARALLRRFGLGYGAMDFIVTPQGEHVFLELNPAGEWGWLERDLGYPISEAIAAYLTERAETETTAEVDEAAVETKTQEAEPAVAEPTVAEPAVAEPAVAEPAVETVQAAVVEPAPSPSLVATTIHRAGVGRPPVLIVTHSGDNECIQAVSAAIERRGGVAVRMDTDRYPTHVGLSTQQRHSDPGRIVTREHDVPIEALQSVWYRRFAAGGRLPASLGDTREAAVGESRRVLHGTIASLPCFQLDRLAAVTRTHHKDLQLRLAAEVGLEVPRTLVTNRPEDVVDLWHELEGRVVTKMQHSFAIYREGRENVVFTTRVRERDLDALDGLRFCPMTFQEELPKKLELRVTVVGTAVMAASIDSARRSRTEVDWRRDGLGTIPEWKPFTLPQDVARKLLALQRALGLNYGAADFVLTPDGRYVFLEVNPVGEFFWLDRLEALPISDTLAAVLLGQAERNVEVEGG